MACGTLFPRSGIEPTSSALESRVLTTLPLGKSCFTLFYFHILMTSYNICLCLTLPTMIMFRSIHVAANGIISFFLWLSNFPLYICTIFSLFIDLQVKVLAAQSCLTLCVPMCCSLTGSSVHGILQEKYWRALPFHFICVTYLLYSLTC